MCITKSSQQIIILILIFFYESEETANGTSSFINFSDALCGKYSGKRNRIVGGTKTNPGEFPWVVSIKHKGNHLCGGVVVNKKWVMSAAHCFCSKTKLRLPISNKNILNPDLFSGTAFYSKEKFTVGINRNGSRENSIQNMRISRLKIHPEYKCNKLENDIALLEMFRDISWENADPACFPNSTSIFSDLTDKSGVAVGWGATNEDLSKGKLPITLHKVRLPIMKNSECQLWYQSQNKSLSLKESQLCAGYKNGEKDTCWADSGGPLMVKDGLYMVVVGIVSTGIGCARASLPGIYTRITEYMNWISLVIN